MAAAHAFAAAVKPGAATRDREAAHPYDELRELARSGMLAIRVPRRFGGAEVSHETVAEVFRIISAADGSLGQIPQNHFVFLEVIEHVGSEAQKAFFFSEFLRGARLGNAQTERGTRHAKAIDTLLSAGSPGRLNGKKYYCTGAISAQWIPVLANDEESGRQVIACVPRDAAGVQVIDDWAAMGQRATASGTTVLTDVSVPREHVLPHWQLFQKPQVWTAIANLPHVAIDVGLAEGALADTIEFLKTRARPWYETGLERAVDDPLLLERLGRLSAKVHAAGEMLRHAARHLDALPSVLNDDIAGQAALVVGEAKAYAGDVAVEVGNELFGLCGSSAADQSLNLDRHWRNARTHTLHDPNRWRYHRLGDFFLNGRLPPNSRSN